MDRAYGKTLHSRDEAACPRVGRAGLEAAGKALAGSIRSQHGGPGAPGRDWAMPGRTTITRCSRPLTSTAKEAAARETAQVRHP